MVRAPDATAQLVQLREPEPIGAVDDDRVRRRDVETTLDDRRAQQQIAALMIEVSHHLLQCALGHLPMCDGESRLRQKRTQSLGFGLDGRDVVMQVIDLAAALELAQHRLAHHAGRVRRDEGLDRQPSFRRGRDHGKVAQALERERQRARNRGRGERQHIDLGAQTLQLLLVPHAEAVLLVDDDESQVLEPDVRLEQPVRTDDQIDAALGEPLEHRFRLLARAEAR